jgi:hypothetical protein
MPFYDNAVPFVKFRVVAGRNRRQAGHPHAALCGGFEKSLSERHGRGMACVNQTRLHYVNQMGKDTI